MDEAPIHGWTAVSDQVQRLAWCEFIVKIGVPLTGMVNGQKCPTSQIIPGTCFSATKQSITARKASAWAHQRARPAYVTRANTITNHHPRRVLIYQRAFSSNDTPKP